MQRILSHLCILVATLSLVVLISACQKESPALQINDVVSDPGAFSGSLTLVGIVSAYAQSDPGIVGVMDKKELQCTTPNCEKVLLAVKVAGTRPAIGDEVRVSGFFSREPWGYLLNADKLEVLAHHKPGGQG